MPLTRSAGTDRRRRVMREAVAADAGVAVESVRAKVRQRIRDRDDADEEDSFKAKRDPGYSQAVRRACQQRLVQLIPVRRSSLMLTIAGVWTIWAILMLAHYYVHVRPMTTGNLPPIAALVHLRSTHGIAHWLGGQLWMLTALASLMIFQLRKHKLDDYRAKYRVWGFLAAAALFSSLDASSSGLYLFGKSMDGWAVREMGYSGWSVVLATYAALVGVLGLRLCSEIKSAPMSLTFWLIGLVAWAASALLGTGLMKTPWTSTTTDLVVGGTWLGGILSVFLAAGIYLRHTYIQAQKRFVLRNGMVSQGKAWKLPRFARRRNEEDGEEISDVRKSRDKEQNSKLQNGKAQEDKAQEDKAQQAEAKTSRFSKFRLPWKRRETESERTPKFVERDETRTSKKEIREREEDESDSRPESKSRQSESDRPVEAKTRRSESRTESTDSKLNKVKSSWLRLPRWRSDPKLGDDFSDVSAERRKRDEGFEEPLAKRQGWFSKKKPFEQEERKETRSTASHKNGSRQSNQQDQDDSNPDFQEEKPSRKSWWKRTTKLKNQEAKPARAERTSKNTDSENSEKKRRWFQRSNKLATADTKSEVKPKIKKSWGLLKKTTSDVSGPDESNASANAVRPKRKLFGFLDNLKLKPPAGGVSKTSPTPVSTSRTSIPSSSVAQRNEPLKSVQNYNEPSQSQSVDDEDDDDDNTRNLSKAERKRLRRQQQENRRAA